MNTRTLGYGSVAAIASMVLGGASPSRAIAGAGGNAPEPAPSEWTKSACTALPDGVSPIAGVVTASAIEQPSSNSVRLLFADHALACRNPSRSLDQAGAFCVDSWRFALTLPAGLLTPGVYDLNEYSDIDFAMEVTETMASGGCNAGGGCSGHGTGTAGGAKGPDGTIQIDDVSESCITGRILRLKTGSADDPDFTGGFQATRCSPPGD